MPSENVKDHGGLQRSHSFVTMLKQHQDRGIQDREDDGKMKILK